MIGVDIFFRYLFYKKFEFNIRLTIYDTSASSPANRELCCQFYLEPN